MWNNRQKVDARESDLRTIRQPKSKNSMPRTVNGAVGWCSGQVNYFRSDVTNENVRN